MHRGTIPPNCPSCRASLLDTQLQCPACATEVSGEFEMSSVCRLNDEMYELFDLFIKARGNLKQVQRELGLSYPTVRQRIEEMFQQLEKRRVPPDPLPILQKVRAGELDIETAEKLLRGDS